MDDGMIENDKEALDNGIEDEGLDSDFGDENAALENNDALVQ